MAYQLAVLSISDVIIKRDCEELRNAFGDTVELKGYTFDQVKAMPPLEEELALIIGPDMVAKQVLPYLPPQMKYLFNQRTIDPAVLPMLFQIPPHTEVLVANDCFINACELIDELRELSIHELKYFPFNPNDPNDPYKLNSSYSSLRSHHYSKTLNEQWDPSVKPRHPGPAYSGEPFKYAITAGEPQEVPQGIPKIVDIGYRKISLMTIADILQFFTGSASYDALVSSRYMKNFVQLSMELAKQNNRIQFLHAQLENVISNFQSGILLMNEDFVILFCNKVAEDILEESNLINHSLKEFLPEQDLSELSQSEFLKIKENMVYVTKTEICSMENERRYLISLESWEQLQSINQQYRKQKKFSENNARYTFSDILYKSETMKNVINKAKVFALNNMTVIITGESGTGKELLAQSIHNASPRKNAPFIAINCGALSEALLESELFGYEEGAFTGAKKGGKPGLFELAHTGTLFLDEVGDTPLTTQTKLLRALQEREILRVGGVRIIPVDVRIIAATNQDLYHLVEKGLFRRDLYYRLRILPLIVPPLRQRPDDIMLLFHHLLSTLSRGRNLPAFPNELKPIIKSHTWPGNIRELRNMIEYYISIHEISSNLTEDIKSFLEVGNEVITPLSTDTGLTPRKMPEEIQFPNAEIKDHCLCILKLLREAKKQDTAFIGRSRLKLEMESSFHQTLSFEQIKSRQKLLSKFGLIVPLVGKGCYLSKAGEAYLAKHED